jgi:hypothetical protein
MDDRRSSSIEWYQETRLMEALIETLNAKLHEWKPETANQVRERVTEIIGLADQDALDLLRSRAREQEVLDLLDEPTAR